MMTGNEKGVEKGNLSEIDHLLICLALKKQRPRPPPFFPQLISCVISLQEMIDSFNIVVSPT